MSPARRVGAQMPDRYREAFSRRVLERDDVTFIPSHEAARRFRRQSVPSLVGFTVFFVVVTVRVLVGDREPLPLIGVVVFAGFVVFSWVTAVRRLRTADDRMPPFGLTIWDDALVSYVGRGDAFVPRSAVQSFAVRRDDAGTALMVIALNQKGETPPRTLGWFTIDPDDLKAAIDTWLARPPGEGQDDEQGDES